MTARDQVGLRALNDALKAAFDQPGRAGFERGTAAATSRPHERDASGPAASRSRPGDEGARRRAGCRSGRALRFKQSPIRLHPGEKRTVTLLADPSRIAPGTPVEIEADPGLTVTLRTGTIPEPGARGYCAVPRASAPRSPSSPARG